MFYDALLFFPAAVSVIFAILLSRRIQRTPAQTSLMWMFVFTAVYLFGDAAYMLPGTQMATCVAADMMAATTTPLIAFCGYLLLRGMLNGKPHGYVSIMVAVLMVVFTSILTMVAVLSGFDNLIDLQAALMREGHTFRCYEGLLGVNALPLGFRDRIFWAYVLLTRPVYFTLILTGVGMVFAYIVYTFRVRNVPRGQLYRFFFQGQPISAFYMLSVLFFIFGLCGIFCIGVGLDFLRSHPWVAGIYSLLLALDLYAIGYTGSVISAPRFTVNYLMQQYDFGDKAVTGPHEQIVKKERAKVQPTPAQSGKEPLPGDSEHLLEALKKLMEEDQLFLNPDLTIEDVAAELNSNRVYISRIVNQLMHMTFRDYVNQLRIRYSKQYMRKHPDVTQEAVAIACGYQDAASFNRKFRAVTGVTPRAWFAKSSGEPDDNEVPSKGTSASPAAPAEALAPSAAPSSSPSPHAPSASTPI